MNRLSPRRLIASGAGAYIGIGAVLALMIIVQAIRQPAFISADNLTSLGGAAAVPLVLTAAMTLVLLTGGVDLSMGSALALAGIVYAKLVAGGQPALLALLVCLGFGAAVGFCVNGVLIGRLRVSFFVITLGTLSLYRGIVFLWTDSRTIDMFDDTLSQRLGNETVFGDRVPVGLLIALGVVLVLYLVLRYTTFGRSVYAVGGNREAAELSGIRTGWVVAAVYGISGCLAALAGVMTIGRVTIADPNMGAGLELQAAAAALLGGVALSGGVGSVFSGVLGVAFFQVLSNVLALAGASASWQLIVTGAALVVAVYLDQMRAASAAAAESRTPAPAPQSLEVVR